MILYLVDKMEKLKVDERQMLRIAHVWCFGTDPDLGNDALELKLFGRIPIYLQRYLKHLQETT